MFNINKMLKSSVVVFFLALGTFAYSSAGANPLPRDCKVCSGRFGGEMSCETVNIGGFHNCEAINGSCEHNGSGCVIG